MRALAKRNRAMVLAALIVLVGAVPYTAWALWPSDVDAPARPARPDPRYASQSGSLSDAREAHIRQRREESVDAALETCGGIGLSHLAAKYGFEEDAERVARRFSLEYEVAYREPVYEACLSGLMYGG